jgi:hypothetical protein
LSVLQDGKRGDAKYNSRAAELYRSNLDKEAANEVANFNNGTGLLVSMTAPAGGVSVSRTAPSTPVPSSASSASAASAPVTPAGATAPPRTATPPPKSSTPAPAALEKPLENLTIGNGASSSGSSKFSDWDDEEDGKDVFSTPSTPSKLEASKPATPQAQAAPTLVQQPPLSNVSSTLFKPTAKPTSASSDETLDLAKYEPKPSARDRHFLTYYYFQKASSTRKANKEDSRGIKGVHKLFR